MIRDYKIIFLDIDGVLNSDDYIERQINRGIHCLVGTEILDTCARDRLKLFLSENLDVKLVISSSWRWWDVKTTKEKFMKTRMCTLVPYIVGVTPRFFSNRSRGREIDFYIKKHHIKDYVIIDDEDYDIHQKDHLVQTTYEHGLTEEHYKDIKRILNIK